MFLFIFEVTSVESLSAFGKHTGISFRHLTFVVLGPARGPALLQSVAIIVAADAAHVQSCLAQ